MNPFNSLSSFENERLEGYTYTDWNNLEDEEQLDYALLLYKKEGKIDSKSTCAIINKIEDYRTSSQASHNIEFDRLAYDYLSNITNYEPREYMYLSWLHKQYEWNSNLTKPIDPEVNSLSLTQFSTTFGYNTERQNLLTELFKFIDNLKIELSVNEIEVMVGGSFTTGKEKPSDIDFAIIIDEATIIELDLDAKLYRLNHSIPTALDFYFLPNTHTSKALSFYEYNIIYRLGNSALIKDKAADRISNNSFATVPLIKVKI